jgi:hypothetical protein
MSLKGAAFLALIGTLLLTIVLGVDLIQTAVNAANGLIPAVRLFSSIVYTFASLTVTVFFFVFYQAQR